MTSRTLLSLVWDDVSLTADSVFVRVKACLAKNGKEAKQPIPAIVVSLLAAPKDHTRPNDSDRVFVSFGKGINTAGLIRVDLATAGIEQIDKDGNEICFHSLRNSYISFLANSQTPAKVVQKLARHSDPRLTFNTYARTFEESEQEALNCLPNFGNFVLSTCLDKSRTEREVLRYDQIEQNGQDALKTTILADKKIPPRGLEPLSHG
jgi:hypothetical protein